MTARSLVNEIGSSQQQTAIDQGLRNRGFTLIELMIVVVIVAILASLAYPGYQDHVLRSRRADGAVNLLELAQFMERNFTVTGRYNRDANGNAIAEPPWIVAPRDAGTTYYNLGFAAGSLTATAFTLEAVPAGIQTSDTLCGTLSINQTGQRFVTGTGTVADCW